MSKPIKVILSEEAKAFLKALPEKVRKKFVVAFDKTENRFKGDWFVKMEGTDEIWEFRVAMNGMAYRLFAFWDGEGEEATLVVCTHGFEKKTGKTPINQIRKAEQMKREYFSPD